MIDSLFRISLKAYIENGKGEVLVVKELGRQWWDLPGGGMEYEESIKEALARELKEEVAFEGDFTYEIIDVEEPRLLARNVWQTRLVFRILPENFSFGRGEHGDDVAFIDPNTFETSERVPERLVCYHARKLRGDTSYDPRVPRGEEIFL